MDLAAVVESMEDTVSTVSLSVTPGWRVQVRDVKTAARVALAVAGSVHLTTMVKGVARLGRTVDVGPVFSPLVRAGVESVTAHFSLVDPAGEVVDTGWVNQSYTYALDPNLAQLRKLRSHAGASRFVYNWALAEVGRRLSAATAEIQRMVSMGADEEDAHYAAFAMHRVTWSQAGLRLLWNEAKDTVAPWWRTNSKEAYNHGLEGIARAFKNYFSSRDGTRKGKPMGWPKRKKRWHHQSFAYTTNMTGFADRTHLNLSQVGSIKLFENASKVVRRLDNGTARISRMTVSWTGRHWQVAVSVIVQRATGRHTRPAHTRQHQILGLDVGVTDLATVGTPDGRTIKVPNPRHYRTLEAKLGRLQAVHAAQAKGSNRYRATARAIARVHHDIAQARREGIHRLTNWLATCTEVLVIEDLNVVGMTARAKPKPDPDRPGEFLPNGAAAKSGLAKSVLDASFGEIRRQLVYKCAWYGTQLIVHPRFQASSGACDCGAKTKLALEDRIWTCSECGRTHDRDGKASIILARHGASKVTLAGSTTESRNGRTALRGPRQPNPARRKRRRVAPCSTQVPNPGNHGREYQRHTVKTLVAK